MVKKILNCIFDIEIDRFNKKGNGIGKIIDGDESCPEIEVPFTIPSEIVKAKILRRKKGRYLSQLIDVIKPSSIRQPPRCQHFGDCGGCRFQHIPYQEELKQKELSILSYFDKYLEHLIEPFTIIESDPEWKYRNKMEFTFSEDTKGNRYLGLIKDSSRGKVLNIQECNLVNPWFVDTLSTVRS